MRTVIEMAIEAELIGNEAGMCCWIEDTNLKPYIELFAELVRADERKAMMQLFTDPENQPTQHGTVTVEYMNREIAAEREACAKVCAEDASGRDSGGYYAEIIRDRSST